MNSEIRLLLEVQALDQEAIELNSQLSRYPQIWDEVKKQLAEKKAAIEEAHKNHDRHQKERRRVEQKIRLFADDHRKYATQLNSLKTQREHEAVQRQIEQVKAKLTQLEEQGLELLESDERIEKAASIATEEYNKYEAFAKIEKERIRKQFNDKKARLADVENAKAKVVSKLSAELLVIYERITKRHPGTAVVAVRSAPDAGMPAPKARRVSKSKAGEPVVEAPVANTPVKPGSCGGCHFSLLPEILVQVRREDMVVTCPNCGRLLSEDENFVSLAASARG
jgi:predicted  nucleic acid-binding Zn-ribbon protein